MKIIFTTIIFIVVLSIVMGTYLFIKTIKDHFDRIRRQKSKPPEEFIEKHHEPTRWEKNTIYIIKELMLLEDLGNREEHLRILKRKVKRHEINEKNLEKLYKKLLKVYNNIVEEKQKLQNFKNKRKINMKKIIILQGISGSGKSTWARTVELENKIILSSDEIRKTEVVKNPFDILMSKIEKIIKTEEVFNIIFDATNTNKFFFNHLDTIVKWGKEYKVEVVVMQTTTPLLQSLINNSERDEEARVPLFIIAGQYMFFNGKKLKNQLVAKGTKISIEKLPSSEKSYKAKSLKEITTFINDLLERTTFISETESILEGKQLLPSLVEFFEIKLTEEALLRLGELSLSPHESPHHMEDIQTHILKTIELGMKVSSKMGITALFHDLGKYVVKQTGSGKYYSHAAISEVIAKELILEEEGKKEIVETVLNHMLFEGERSDLVKAFNLIDQEASILEEKEEAFIPTEEEQIFIKKIITTTDNEGNVKKYKMTATSKIPSLGKKLKDRIKSEDILNDYEKVVMLNNYFEQRGDLIEKSSNKKVQEGMIKFYNLGELFQMGMEEFDPFNEETVKEKNIRFYRKMDGSLVKVSKWNGEYLITGRTDFFDNVNKGDFDRIKKELFTEEKFKTLMGELKEGTTLFFEIMTPDHVIVVEPKEWTLTFLGSKTNNTYSWNKENELTLMEVKEIFKEGVENEEGVVIEFDLAKNKPARMLAKIKTEWYTLGHSIRDLEILTIKGLFKKIILSAKADRLDDLIYFINKAELDGDVKEGVKWLLDNIEDFNSLIEKRTLELEKENSTWTYTGEESLKENPKAELKIWRRLGETFTNTSNTNINEVVRLLINAFYFSKNHK